MITIYHNPRCSKSRQGLAILEASGQDFEVVKYIDTPLSYNQLKNMISMLKIAPEELIRKGESIWKENYKGKKLSDKELIEAMVLHPKLIERPIVIRDKQGIIGRPPENINSIL